MIPFFADNIRIVAHTATEAGHIDKPLTIREFAAGGQVALYELHNGDLRCERRVGHAPYPFIEGREVS